MASSIESISARASHADILAIFERDGVVILEDLLTDDQVAALNADLDAHMESLETGGITTTGEQFGDRTKRFSNLPTASKVFREELLDHEILLGLTDEILVPPVDPDDPFQAAGTEGAQSYWLTTAQIIELHPGQTPQTLHRDSDAWPAFRPLGPKAPELCANYLIALNDYRDDVGATRVIPGSHKWPDYNDRGSQEQTVAAEMRPGSAVLLSSKTVHGGGANVTKDRTRRALAVAYNVGWIVPEDAYPFTVPMELARQLSPRAQQLLGFRSFGDNTWVVNHQELAHFLELN